MGVGWVGGWGGARMRTGGAMATVGQDENPDEKTGLFPP